MSANNALGTYLDTKNLLRHRNGVESNLRVEDEAASAPSASRAVELLGSIEFPVTMSQLLERTGWEVGEFAEAIKVLRQAGLVEVEQTDKGDQVRLTEQGQALRPA